MTNDPLIVVPAVVACEMIDPLLVRVPPVTVAVEPACRTRDCPAAVFPDRWPPAEVKLSLDAPLAVKLRLAPLIVMGLPEVVPASWLKVPRAPREPPWTVKVPWLEMAPLAPLVTVPPLRTKDPAAPICRVWVPLAPPMFKAATWVLVLSVTV